MEKVTLQDILEIHRITCAEQDCSPEAITGQVAVMAADQVALDDPQVGDLLRRTAGEMDQPVALWQIRATLQKHGVR